MANNPTTTSGGLRLEPLLSVLPPTSLQQPQLPWVFPILGGAACFPGRCCLCLDAFILLGPLYNHRASLCVPTCGSTTTAGYSYVFE
ncbi:hypothetical protein I79_000202 [Cricetulus griseus]|uniref:Uncharacterized protein n=1 Tax=Cricetulus griseus TaxID=10029 RepID=G3GRQ9_CRIGR|nr:hypothetical protein I79_000202 [Cricetulus griseus]